VVVAVSAMGKETDTTTWEPRRTVRAMASATARIRSASPTDVPPNFCTTNVTTSAYQRP
jgi:hypothetical protein